MPAQNPAKAGPGLWTDDYSSLLPILNLRGSPKKD